MTTTINIIRIDEPDELFCHYDGEFEPQGVVLVLDLESGDFTARYDPHVGGGMPESVFHNRALWQEMPCLTADAANEMLEALAPVAQRILDGASIEWNGNNHVGVLDADAQAAYDELVAAIEEWATDTRTVGEWKADDWFGPEGREQTIERLGLTADTTDAQIDEIAEKEAEGARFVADYGYVVLTGAVDYLTDLREEMRDTLRERLQEVGEQINELTEERAALVRQQVGWGDSTRAVGAAAGLSHTHVQRLASKSVSYTETYDMYGPGDIAEMGLDVDLERRLREALDGPSGPEIRAEIEREITRQIRQHGVDTKTGEWLGEWSARDIVQAVLHPES